jgi:hypothetical protein
MGAKRYAIWLIFLVLLFLAGCATSPEAESRRAAIEADIEEILSLPVTAELGGPKRCLAEHDYRSFRPLDDKFLLFEGRRGKLWINELRTTCPDLRHGHVLVVRSFSPSRVCDTDRFQMTDWFYRPWYRRWGPWHWGSDWGAGVYCSLGKFYPVTAGQVAEIEAVLERR